MSDLNLVDLLYAVIGIGCLIGLLILRTPTPRPVTRRARQRVNKAIEERGGE